MRCEVEEIARDVVEEIPAVDAPAVTGENIVALRPASRKFRGADLGEEQRHAVLRIGQPGNGIYAGECGGYRRGIAALDIRLPRRTYGERRALLRQAVARGIAHIARFPVDDESIREFIAGTLGQDERAETEDRVHLIVGSIRDERIRLRCVRGVRCGRCGGSGRFLGGRLCRGSLCCSRRFCCFCCGCRVCCRSRRLREDGSGLCRRIFRRRGKGRQGVHGQSCREDGGSSGMLLQENSPYQ